ncbi:hypothetical protein ABFV99_23885 [Cytobacillus horneckiae]|uniref:hypothetical protein n=1 Tax=Cytobacillus horneckiae TaxID=549687 RepID=UPI0034CED6D3
MDTDFAKIAAEILKSMYDHNSKVYSSVGRTELGPEPLTVEQVANDLRVIYNELIKHD